MQKLKETRDTRCIYESELEKGHAFLVHTKIYQEEQHLNKYLIIRHLHILVIHNRNQQAQFVRINN